MRLLMSTDTVGGVFTYALDLCRALDRHGVEVIPNGASGCAVVLGDIPSALPLHWS